MLWPLSTKNSLYIQKEAFLKKQLGGWGIQWQLWDLTRTLTSWWGSVTVIWWCFISPWQSPGRTVWPWSQTATCTACLRHRAARGAAQGICTVQSALVHQQDRMPGLFWNTVKHPCQLKNKAMTKLVTLTVAFSTDSYPRKRLRYCLLQVDQKKTPLFPARVGDMMLPSVLRHGFPSPSWIIPKLEEKTSKK